MARAPLRRLMLATEGTAHDAGAERVALALADALSATLTVVVPLVTNEELLGVDPGLALQTEASAGATLRRLAAAGRGGVRVQTDLRRGTSVAQEIIAAAAAHDAELVVTRRVGRRGLLARLLVGEMVSNVAARMQRPVLMTPETATGLWPHAVLVPASMRTGATDALAAALAAVAGVAVDATTADASQAIARATTDDLVVLALRATDVAAGRLDRHVEALIGTAPCPTLLVPAGADVAGRA